MNVLYLAHRIPYPPDKGDKIRSYHQVRHLAERHKVALVCFADDRRDLRHADALLEFCASVDVVYRSPRTARLVGLRGLLDGRSISVAAFDSRSLHRAAATRLRECDVAIGYSSVMAQYVPEASSIPRLMDFVDVDSDKWRLYAERHRGPAAWIYAREADLLGRYEEAIARSWDHSLFTSEREVKLLAPRVPGRPFSVLQTGVDLEYFHPPLREGKPSAAEPPSLVFTGVMDYFPNVDGVRHFCSSIFPRVRDAVPGTRFVIVGRNPSRSVRALARLPGVEVTGTVPDVRPFLASASVAVTPLRLARGLQSKILEAMAMGLPVIATSAALDGLDAARDSGAVAADEPQDFADRVVQMLRDRGLREEAGLRARAYVERHHRWADHGAALETLLEQIATRRPRSGREAVS